MEYNISELMKRHEQMFPTGLLSVSGESKPSLSFGSMKSKNTFLVRNNSSKQNEKPICM